MSYISGVDRNQVTLFPECLEDYIEEDNPVRLIDAFVDSLDMLKLGFPCKVPGLKGRPGYDPADMLRLYLYGYVNGVRSSRKLERETHRNIEVIWMMRRLQPDFKTIADFRKDNPKAIREGCKHFTLLCREAGLVGGELVAVDGSKFKAVNNPKMGINQARLNMIHKDVEKLIESYLTYMDENDKETPAPISVEKDLRKRMAILRKDKKRIESILKKAGHLSSNKPEIAENGNDQSEKQTDTPEVIQPQEAIDEINEIREAITEVEEILEQSESGSILANDPEARLMKTRKGTIAGYNVQTVVDSKHHLIIGSNVFDLATDSGLLTKMTSEAMADLGIRECVAVADVGYCSYKDIAECMELNITALVPLKRDNDRGLYKKSDFIYDPERNIFICPAKEELHPVPQKKEFDYKNYETCKCHECPLKKRCSTSPRPRRIKRWNYEDAVDEMRKILKAKPDVMKVRSAIVEHPFGYMKDTMGWERFLLKGLEKVKTEVSLTVCSYNIKRAIKIIEVPELIKLIKKGVYRRIETDINLCYGATYCQRTFIGRIADHFARFQPESLRLHEKAVA